MQFRALSLVFLAASAGGFATGLGAQRTWIVDSNRGTGTDFVDIQPAFDAARRGDTIRVRRGTYTPSTTSKGLRVLGESGAVVTSRKRSTRALLTIFGLGPADHFVLSNLAFESNPANESTTVPGIALTRNAGTVHLDRLTVRLENPDPRGKAPALWIHGCAAVTITDGSFLGGPALRVQASVVAATGTTWTGHSFWGKKSLIYRAWPGIVAEAASVDLTFCNVLGGDGFTFVIWDFREQPAIEFQRSEIQLAGDSRTRLTAGRNRTRSNPTPAILARSGLLVVDRSVRLIASGGGKRIDGASQVRFASLSAARVRSAAPGHNITTEVHGIPNTTVVEFLGARRQPVASPFGPLWFDPSSAVLLDAARIGNSRWHRKRYRIPNDPALHNLDFVFQGLSAPAGFAPFVATNPVHVVLR